MIVRELIQRTVRPFGLVLFWAHFLFLLAGIAQHALAAQEETENGGARLTLALKDDLLTIDAVDVPLDTLLSAIGKDAGFRTLVKGDLTTKVTRAFSDLPLDKALKQLLAGIRYIQIRSVVDESAQKGRIFELRVFGEGTGGPLKVARRLPNPTTTAGEDKGDLKQRILLDLQSADRGTRLRAIRQLDQVEGEEALRILTWVLESDEDAAVRGYSVRALQHLGGEAAVAALEKGLDDPEAAIRAHIIRSLGRIPVERSVLTLGRVLQGHRDAGMRRLAVQALSLHKDEKVPALLEAATGDTDHRVRRFARRVLANRE